MPAYFSILFELEKTKTVIKNFYDALVKSGVSFKSGYWGSENDTLENILEWNQNKLDKNFNLGYREHYSNDYKQMLLNYSNFTEVRLYIINDKKSSSFRFNIIVPEDDLLYDENKNGKWILKQDASRMVLLKELAISLWNSIEILAIQTAWESSDIPPKANEISMKCLPQFEPFCIIQNKFDVKELDLNTSNLDNNGLLIEDGDGK